MSCHNNGMGFLLSVPEEFMYNPVSRSYGTPHKRPEVQNATIEFIAPSEYMVTIFTAKTTFVSFLNQKYLKRNN